MTPRPVIIGPEARNDILSLYDRIAEAATPAIALAYLERLERHLANFDIGPERGTRRDDVRPGLRVSGFERRVTIAFRVEPERVTILRIFPAGRDWEQAF